MRDVTKLQAICVLLTVAVGLAVTPAVAGFAQSLSGKRETAAQRQSSACGALAGDLGSALSDVQSSLVAVPPSLDGVPGLVNGLLVKVTSLIDLGCLPAVELPVSAPVAGNGPADKADKALADKASAGEATLPGIPLPSAGLPLPSLSAELPGLAGLGAVPVCTDLTADLLATVSNLLAALLSTGVPDLTKALDAVTGLLDTVTKLTGADCLPAAPVA
jgi:hypothetical protein